MNCLTDDYSNPDVECRFKAHIISLSPYIKHIEQVLLHDNILYWKVQVTCANIGKIINLLTSNCTGYRFFENDKIDQHSLKTTYNIRQFIHIRLKKFNNNYYKLNENSEKCNYINCHIDDVIVPTTQEELKLFGRIQNKKTLSSKKKTSNTTLRNSVNAYKNPKSQLKISMYLKS